MAIWENKINAKDLVITDSYGIENDMLTPDGRLQVSAINSYGEGVCTKCKKTAEIALQYNATSNNKLERKICKVCHTEALDNFYGLAGNAELERFLYE